MAIYTKKGDDGTTGLLSGQRISKADRRIEVLGTLDELNSQIGVCVAIATPNKFATLGRELENIQRDLFSIGSKIADLKISPIGWLDDRTANLEQAIDRTDRVLPKLANFILPGGDILAAQLHLARSICRRAERRLVKYQSRISFVKYLNRLSDYFFTAALQVNHQTKTREIVWKVSA